MRRRRAERDPPNRWGVALDGPVCANVGALTMARWMRRNRRRLMDRPIEKAEACRAAAKRIWQVAFGGFGEHVRSIAADYGYDEAMSGQPAPPKWKRWPSAVWWAVRVRVPSVVCAIVGHDVVDRSSGGPESGNMDHECARCGEFWHVPLY